MRLIFMEMSSPPCNIFKMNFSQPVNKTNRFLWKKFITMIRNLTNR